MKTDTEIIEEIKLTLADIESLSLSTSRDKRIRACSNIRALAWVLEGART